jgi:uncharacterized repeat protein (TIGR03803 family)
MSRISFGMWAAMALRPSFAFRRFTALCVILFLFALFFVSFALGQTERLLHSFGANGDGVGDGDLVVSSLTPDGHGNLFGVTYYGGTYAAGTVFELSPPAQGQTAWTETIIHSFQPFVTTDGSFPTAGVTFDRSGNLYGTTGAGGTSHLGVVYELSPPAQSGDTWTEQIIYNFAYYDHGTATTGTNPGGVAFVKGNLYVSTKTGGPENEEGDPFDGNGNVLEIKPPAQAGGAWLVKQIFDFSGGSGGGGSGGAGPMPGGGALIADSAGNLYGTAIGTSANSEPYVIVFELSPPSSGNEEWTETVIGASQYGNSTSGSLVFDKSGNLYGTIYMPPYGYSGTVFKLLLPAFSGQAWTWLTLYTFDSSSPQNGWFPYAGVVLDQAGNLYGATNSGGTSTACGNDGCGTVFELSPTFFTPWTETVLYNFSGSPRDGDRPTYAPTLGGNGHIYGTAGGGAYSGGAAFEVVP